MSPVFTPGSGRKLSLTRNRLTAPLSSRFLLDVSGSLLRVSDNFRPEPGVNTGDISHFDSVTNTYTLALPTYHDNPEVRGTVQASMTYIIGEHDVKAGYQYMREQSGFPYTSTSGMRAVFRNGVPDSVNTYNTPVSYMDYDSSHAVYF